MEILLLSLLFGVYVFSLCLFLLRVVFNGKSNLEKELDFIQAMGRKGDAGNREVQKKKKKRLTGFNISEKLREELEGSGIQMSGQEYLILWSSLIMIPPLLAYFLTGRLKVVLLVLVVCTALPPAVVKTLRKKRLEKFSGQLGDALMTVSNCLRSGFSFRQAIERVSTDMLRHRLSLFTVRTLPGAGKTRDVGHPHGCFPGYPRAAGLYPVLHTSFRCGRHLVVRPHRLDPGGHPRACLFQASLQARFSGVIWNSR